MPSDVFVDASYRQGVAGLAAVFDAGEGTATDLCLADSALHGEWMALALGMQVAAKLMLASPVRFWCDSNQVTMALSGLLARHRLPDLAAHHDRVASQLAANPGWSVTLIAGANNPADALSRKVRRVFENSPAADAARAQRDRALAAGEAEAAVRAHEFEVRQQALPTFLRECAVAEL